MTKKIVVNVSRRETRVAMLEDGRLAELKLERERDVLGNVYTGTVENVVSGLDAAFVECGLDRNVFLHVSDAVLEEPTRQMLRRKMDSFPPIAEVLQPGQELLVQVTKGSVGSKGPRATRRISLPGRYLVLMVQGGNKVGVSRKIADEAERERLRDLGEKVKPEGMGIIIRTRAEGVGRTELQHDVTFLTRLWSSIQRRAKRTPAPAVIHEDLSLVFEIIRDVFSAEVEELVVDDAEIHAKVQNLVGSIAPELKARVKLYEGTKPLFVELDIEKQIERSLRPRVWLPQGGHIHIDQTEALTAIDVNSGKFTGARSLTDTVLRTNLQAVEEVVRQVRVRDIGGIIVVDFIDMDNPRHRREVMAKLKEEMKKDRVRTRVVHLTPLGLVEMTRKRTGDPLNAQLQSSCPCCEGRGRITSVETLAIRIEERLRELAAKDGARDFRVTCSPGACLQLLGVDGSEIGLLEEELGRRIHVRCSSSIHPERFVVHTGAPDGLTKDGLPFTPGEVITIEPSQALDITSEGLLASVDGCLVHVPDESHTIDQPCEVRLVEVTRSYVRGTLAAGKPKHRGREKPGPDVFVRKHEAAEAEADFEAVYAAEETSQPSAEAGPEAPAPARKRRWRPRGGRRKAAAAPAPQPESAEAPGPAAEPSPVEEALAAEPASEPPVDEVAPPAEAPRKRRRPRSRRKPPLTGGHAAQPDEHTPAPVAAFVPAAEVAPAEEAPADEGGQAGAAAEPTRRSRWRSRPRRKAAPAEQPATAAQEAHAQPAPAAPVAVTEEPPSQPVQPSVAPRPRRRPRISRRKTEPPGESGD